MSEMPATPNAARAIVELFDKRIYMPESEYYATFADLLMQNPDFQPKIDFVYALLPHIGDWRVLDGEQHNPHGITFRHDIKFTLLSSLDLVALNNRPGVVVRPQSIDLQTGSITNKSLADLCGLSSVVHEAYELDEQRTIRASAVAKAVIKDVPPLSAKAKTKMKSKSSNPQAQANPPENQSVSTRQKSRQQKQLRSSGKIRQKTGKAPTEPEKMPEAQQPKTKSIILPKFIGRAVAKSQKYTLGVYPCEHQEGDSALIAEVRSELLHSALADEISSNAQRAYETFSSSRDRVARPEFFKRLKRILVDIGSGNPTGNHNRYFEFLDAWDIQHSPRATTTIARHLDTALLPYFTMHRFNYEACNPLVGLDKIELTADKLDGHLLAAACSIELRIIAAQKRLEAHIDSLYGPPLQDPELAEKLPPTVKATLWNLYEDNRTIANMIGKKESIIRAYLQQAKEILAVQKTDELLVAAYSRGLIDTDRIPDFKARWLSQYERDIVIDCWDLTRIQTAAKLGISASVIGDHLNRVYARTGARSRRQLNLMLIKAGAVPPKV